MQWTLDRVVNFTEDRLDMLINVLEEFSNPGEYDAVRLFERLIELNYVNEPTIREGESLEQVYKKKWGSYVGTIHAYGIAIIHSKEKSIEFTEITEVYRRGEINFREYLLNQMIKWQLPNGGLTASKRNEYLREGILVKPFILVLQVLLALANRNKFDSWLDPYDINNFLLVARDNSEDSVETVVSSIIKDREEKLERNVDFSSDVIFNSFCSTDLIRKIDTPSYIPGRNIYVLNEERIEEINFIIDEFKEPRFVDEASMEDKITWLNYYGSYIDFNLRHATDDNTKLQNIQGIGTNLILYGSPGTGKSFELDRRYANQNSIRVTFHPEYTYHDFVGSYRPEPLYKEVNTCQFVTEENKVFEKGEPYINYRFVPGPFTLILERALSSLNSNEPQMFTLIIEEINRANTPAVFGDLFQLLDRDGNGESRYGVTNLEILKYLKSKRVINKNETEIKLPRNLNLVATMNSADQGVFVLDSAFKRRWTFEYLPIKPEEAEHKDELVAYNNKFVRWADFITSLNNLLADLGVNEDRHFGPYFLKQGEPSNKQIVASKLLMYLWDDVGRTKRDKIFIHEIKTFSQLVYLYGEGYPVFQTDFIYSDITTVANGNYQVDYLDELK